jgi:hypothetical protein
MFYVHILLDYIFSVCTDTMLHNNLYAEMALGIDAEAEVEF